MSAFSQQYGPWALIAGGAQGIGEAYARHLAKKGLNLVIVDLSAQAIGALLPELEREYKVETLGIELDLAQPDTLDIVTAAIGDRQVGMLIYNAGIADVGPFYKEDGSLDFELKRLAVNVTGPLVFSYHFAKNMLARKKGGIVLMSSGAGLQGSPYYAHYSATKAYDIALAQALWYEFKPYNVDVLACVAGMTLSTAAEAYQHLDTSTFQTTDELVIETLEALGKQSTLIAGEHNRENREVLAQFPTDTQIELIASHPITNFLGGEVPKQHYRR